MPVMPDNYYDRFDAEKNYEKILYRAGYTLQSAELNEQQSMAARRLRDVADALFKDGDVIRDASVLVDPVSGLVRAAAGAVYLRGAVRGVVPAEFTIPTSGTVAIGVRLTESVVSELDDPSLYNPAIGSRGEGEPGAWRLRVQTTWGWDGDGGEGEFFAVYTVDNGELRAREAPPSLDSFAQSIARYDRDSTAGGSYIVSGLTVRDAGDGPDGHQIYTVAEGRARVYGRGVDLPTSRRIVFAAEPDLRLIDTEVSIADESAGQEGGQRVSVAHPPIRSIEAVRITTRKTVSLVHGNYSGCADALPDSSVVAIVECRQGDTVFAQGGDYRKNGDRVDWSPSGAEPANGSTYSCTYDCIVAVEPLNPDEDGFSVEGAVAGSSIIVNYRQALPCIDRLAINQDGQFVWITGVGGEDGLSSPSVPEGVLALATVFQTWRNGAGRRQVVNDGVRAVPFSEITAINERIDYLMREVSRTRLETDVSTREAGARAGLFVDPLLDDSMRDQGMEQTAAIVDGVLTLPIAATVSALSADVTAPTAAPYTPRVFLEQPYRTGEMRVNPYDAFEPLPGRLTLTPALDRWTDTDTTWASPITQRFDTGHYVPGRSWVGSQSVSSAVQNLGSSTTELEYLRQIQVSFRGEGFGAGEELERITFDGVALDVKATADAAGVLSGAFTIPPRIPAGAKTVEILGRGGTRASGVFVGQGLLTVTTLREVHTVSTFWYDPLAQTFVPGKATQLVGCDLWFTACASSPRVQIREVQCGVPGRTILAEAALKRADVKLDGPTRVIFDVPLRLAADGEYALVVLCDDAETSLAVAELGGFDAHAQTWITSQPYQVGVLLSSSNASTWTAHQDKDLAFRLLEAEFAPGVRALELGAAEVAGATDLLLLALAETPSAATRVEYALSLPDGSEQVVAAGQPLRFAEGQSGPVSVRARLSGDTAASPLLWPGSQLVAGAVSLSADYCTRSITAAGANRAVLIYDALVPSGAAVTPEIRIDGGDWQAMNADAAVNQGDGVAECRWSLPLNNAREIKVRLTLTGSSLARPQVGNIRFMAVI